MPNNIERYALNKNAEGYTDNTAMEGIKRADRDLETKATKEIWKDIKGYEGLYQVSNLGRVRSLDRYVKQNHNTKQLKKGKIIQPTKNHKGYLGLKLCKENTSKKVSIHRLVAQTFIPNLENKPQVNHINGIKTDNGVENLEWCTCSENIKHAFDTGLKKSNKGVNNPMYGKHHTEETKKKIGGVHKGKTGEKHPRSKKVKCITTGDVFVCIREAGRKYNVANHDISKCCKGKRKSAGKHPVTGEKLVWEYLSKGDKHE